VPFSDRVERRRGLLAAVGRGTAILRDGGSALDAVTATVAMLEDDALFNAGYGSTLTIEGRVEMDAAVMAADGCAATANSPLPQLSTRETGKSKRQTAQRKADRSPMLKTNVRAGGVVLVSRVRNPILLARVVMEQTPHVLIGGPAAERLARQARIPLCRPEQLVTERARKRWLAVMEGRGMTGTERHGTVGAAAVDHEGNLAAATSTGGVSGKMPGRIGDSAIIGAGLDAAEAAAASATGAGEAIMKVCLCRTAVALLPRMSAQQAAVRAIEKLHAATGGEAGLVMVDAEGRFGYAHNAQAMEIALCGRDGEIRHLTLEPAVKGPTHH
jgi:beta-aspartyl-peptidase (threonine type)